MRKLVVSVAVIGLLAAAASAQGQWVKVYHAGAGAAVAAPHFQPTPGPTSY